MRKHKIKRICQYPGCDVDKKDHSVVYITFSSSRQTIRVYEVIHWHWGQATSVGRTSYFRGDRPNAYRRARNNARARRADKMFDMITDFGRISKDRMRVR